MRIAVGLCYLVLFCLSLLLNCYGNPHLGPEVLSWKYDEITQDNLQEDWEWVKEKAMETGADNEGAWAYIADICGDDKSEAVLSYFIDGIIFANSLHMEVYSADKTLLFKDSGYMSGLEFGLLKVNGAFPIYGFGLNPILTSYAYKNDGYVKWLPGLPVAWSWLLAHVFIWAFYSPPEIGLLFVGMQILFCWLVFLIERRSIVNPSGFKYKPFLKRVMILLGVETLVAIPASFVPLLFLFAPIFGILLFMKVLQPSKTFLQSESKS